MKYKDLTVGDVLKEGDEVYTNKWRKVAPVCYGIKIHCQIQLKYRRPE